VLWRNIVVVIVEYYSVFFSISLNSTDSAEQKEEREKESLVVEKSRFF
jgi:hypothetical protein